MIEPRRLYALRAVASARSFSRAARTLGYTQSAISQQIAALERETGLQLVERGTRPVALTEAGRTLLRGAEPVFGHLANVERLVGELAGTRAHELRVAAFPSACSTILAPAIAALRRLHPQIELSLVEAEPDDAARMLKAGEIDLAIAYSYPVGDDPGDGSIQREALFDEPLLLVLPTGHRLLRRRRLSLRELAAEQWIVPPAAGPSSRYRLMFAAACSEAGFEPRVAFEIEDTRAGQALVAEGLGIALLPRLALEPVSLSVRTRTLTSGPPLRRVAAWTLAGPSRPAVTELRRLLDVPG